MTRRRTAPAPAAALAALALLAGCAHAGPAPAAGEAAQRAADAAAGPGGAGAEPGDAFAEGVRLEGAGDPAGAARAFERALAADPALSWAGVNAAVLRERLGETDAAGALYARVLDGAPGFAPAARGLARLSLRRGDVAGAEREIRGRLARAPDSPGLLVALADVLLAAGRLDEAVDVARRALKLDERSLPAMVDLATAYHGKKRHELARMVLENALHVDDRDPAVWNRLGFVDLALGNRAQALEDFRTAAALGPEYAEARANHGVLLADSEDYEGAVAELEAAVKHAPASAAAWLDLGNAYRGLQRFEQAEAAYARARELDPGLREVEFDLAVLYLDGEKPGTPALARLEQAVAFLDAYEKKGGAEPKVREYRADAGRAIEREKKRLAREERDRLRREAEARKKEAAAAATPSTTPTSTSTSTSTSTTTERTVP